MWPDTAPDWKYVDRVPDLASQNRATHVLRRLVQFSADAPATLQFRADAQELFVEWLAELERKIRGQELHPALISHLSKYRKLMPALALLFELADAAAYDARIEAVSLQHARQAAAWCEYLESHAHRVYSCIVTPQMRAARELADKIMQRKVGAKGSFSGRDVYIKNWSGLDSPLLVKLAVEILEDAGWLRPLNSDPKPTGGRPASSYEINPRIWE